jgi:hypothetical protein
MNPESRPGAQAAMERLNRLEVELPAFAQGNFL